jgi:hypothetical protein
LVSRGTAIGPAWLDEQLSFPAAETGTGNDERRGREEALVLRTKDESEPNTVWASPALKKYKLVWERAAQAGLVDPASDWGESVQIDHVFSRKWVSLSTKHIAYVKLYPSRAEVNAGAGGGRERMAGRQDVTDGQWRGGIRYAGEVEILKMLCHPFGGFHDPEWLFAKRKR